MMRRNPALDGLRGIAVLLVTVSHSNVPVLKYGGIAGVTLFFVLSGYLITTILISERHATGSISLKKFYVRRALRLVPALTVALVVGSLLAIATGEARGATLRAALLSLFYLGNIALLTGVPMAPFGTYWSLAMEEQYYLVWPLFLLATKRMRPGIVIVLTAIIAGVSLALRFRSGFATVGGYHIAYYSPLTNGWALLAGSLLALRRHLGPIVVPKALVVGAAIGLLLTASVLALRTGFHEVAGPTAYTTRLLAGPLAALCSLVLVASAANRRHDARWLCHPVLVFFGSISYAVYLWHGIFDHVLGRQLGATGVHGVVSGTIASGLAIGVAVLSYRYVEQPVLKLRPRVETSAFATG